MIPDTALTNAQSVRAMAFWLAGATCPGHGAKSFAERFPRAEEIEAWLLRAGERVEGPGEVSVVVHSWDKDADAEV